VESLRLISQPPPLRTSSTSDSAMQVKLPPSTQLETKL